MAGRISMGRLRNQRNRDLAVDHPDNFKPLNFAAPGLLGQGCSLQPFTDLIPASIRCDLDPAAIESQGPQNADPEKALPGSDPFH